MHGESVIVLTSRLVFCRQLRTSCRHCIPNEERGWPQSGAHSKCGSANRALAERVNNFKQQLAARQWPKHISTRTYSRLSVTWSQTVTQLASTWTYSWPCDYYLLMLARPKLWPAQSKCIYTTWINSNQFVLQEYSAKSIPINNRRFDCKRVASELQLKWYWFHKAVCIVRGLNKWNCCFLCVVYDINAFSCIFAFRQFQLFLIRWWWFKSESVQECRRLYNSRHLLRYGNNIVWLK